MTLLNDHPGLLFVAATLVPLAVFVLLLLAGGLRNLLRAYKHSEPWGMLFKLLGGEVTGRGPAYVGLAGIVIAFFLSFSGFCAYLGETSELARSEAEMHDKIKDLNLKAQDGNLPADERAKAKKDVKQIGRDIKTDQQKFDDRWKDSIIWATVLPANISDPAHGTTLTVGYRIDTLSAIMFVMVTFVASLIFLFSIGYMSDELKDVVEDHEVHGEDGGHYHRRGRYGRFFLFLSLFCFSMLNLLLADNLFQIFVSWELVGICSFLLIGFYFERQSAGNAANKAFITNRVGDAGFIIGLLIIWTQLGTFNFQEIFARLRCDHETAHGIDHAIGEKDRDNRIISGVYNAAAHSFVVAPKNETGKDVLIMWRQKKHIHFDEAEVDGKKVAVVPDVQERPAANQYSSMPYWMLVLAGLGIFLGCVGKSAQFPLQVWLPDAMEGPTPVSALIHAATMVAAGVYLVGRAYPLFCHEVLLTIAYIGMITCIVAASIAMVQVDIKKVLAYSTVSQLGLMMLGLGVGGWAAGLFHLITHACFKALLFLGSGSVIYGCHHEQNMQKMGGLYPKMKITAITMFIGCCAISGFPFFSGWYSKDSVLAAALGYSWKYKHHFLLFILPTVGAGLTTFYMWRMWFMTFTGKPRDHHVHDHAHETPWMLTTPLVVLAVLSVAAGWSLRPWDAAGSVLEHLILESRPASLEADFGPIHVDTGHDAFPEVAVGKMDAAVHEDEPGHMVHGIQAHDDHATVNGYTHKYHSMAGLLALAMVALGLSFSLASYYFKVLDPGESQDRFPGVHRFLWHKWYFDELYSAIIVRPGLAISQWCAAFDRVVIDGLVNGVGRSSVSISTISGKADRGIVDGLVNLVANVSYAIGAWFRNVQTGFLRTYILFLALAAIALFVLLLAFAGNVASGPP